MRTSIGLKALTATLTAVSVLVLTGATSYAQYGYGSGGSWGGSGGSSGGSWGYSRGGSSGGGPLRRLAAHIFHHHQGSYGSSGGSWGGSSGGSSGGRYSNWGSSGGSSGGSYVVYSSNGSSGGSSGGYRSNYAPAYSSPVYYSDSVTYGNPIILQEGSVLTPGAVVPNAANPASPVDANKAPVTNPPANSGEQPSVNPQNPAETNSDTSLSGDARLRIRLPADATVYVNGQKTKTPGEVRSYVSRNLEANRVYPYEVRAVVTRDGQELVQTKVVDLTAGTDKQIGFDFDGTSEILTSISLSVPDDARVILGGTPTEATGSFRYFSTKELTSGQSWSKYEIVVSIVRDGKELTRRQVIDLSAGESKQLAFDFDGAETLVAAK